jgi:predicted HTH transcriptional regulator
MEKQETNRVEFKRELTEDLERGVVAFLNYHQGGILYIGVDDLGSVRGVDSVDVLQRKITDRIKNNILPPTLGLFDVIAEKRDDKDIVKIIISSGPEKPYYLRKYGMSPSGCFVRVGSAVQPMTTDMIDLMHAKRTRNSLGAIPSRRQELTFEQLKIYYEAAGLRLNNQFAKNLGLLTEDKRFNYAAFLLADENNVSIKVARYSGSDKVDLVENEEYGYCSLVKATKSVIDKLNVVNVTKTKITGRERKERRLVDVVALREALLNAVLHNDYVTEIPPLVEIFSDKIVITSSGGLPQDLTEEEFFSGVSAPRNTELMRVFKDLNLAEQIGSGMRRILSVYDRSIFNITEHFLRVTFYFDDDKTTSDVTKNVIENVTKNVRLNSTQEKIVRAIERNKHVTTTELASLTGITKRQILRNIKQLTVLGIIAREGTHRTGSWVITETVLTDDKENTFHESIESSAEQRLSELYGKIDKMLANGVITREQYSKIMQTPEDDA